ncbi:MAG: hypothetical protein ACK5SX_12955 [Sandaracinobacter sp.]
MPIPDNPAIGSYADVGNVELKMRDFYPRKLTQDVNIQPKGGRKTRRPKHNLCNGKTLWDIDAQALCTGGARQKVKVDIVINSDKYVYFQTVMIGGRLWLAADRGPHDPQSRLRRQAAASASSGMA